jgi:hypothetical protein
MKVHLQTLPAMAEVRFVNGVRPALRLRVQAPIQAIASTASLAALDFRQSTAMQSLNGGNFFTFHHRLPLVLNLVPFLLLFYFVFSVKCP